MTAGTIEIPGFSDPVTGAQTTFRAVLDAMARPGRICPVNSGLRPPAPLDEATAAVALTLFDQETAICLDAVMQAAAPWLTFHAGSPTVADLGEADFVLASRCPDLPQLQTGTDEAPEASATLILQIGALGSGAAYRLAGPGLAAPFILRATGLPDDFAAIWHRNHALFPRGVDMVICAGNRLAALPRSVKLEPA
jgi:alpha-D-ribose 1-methylphosphonate 5-triphosphate synthase subunit PhnH